MMNSISYQIGLPKSYRHRAAELYEEAFQQKFTPIVKSREKMVRILDDGIKPELAVVALEDDRLVGLAGFYHSSSSFTGGINTSNIIKHLGLIRGLWTVALFAILYERKVSEGELFMDGIVVDAEMRGRGVGTAILEKLSEFAKENGYRTIKLEVIDTNSRARKLYESEGFKEIKTDHHPYLKPFFGFSSSTTMVKELSE